MRLLSPQLCGSAEAGGNIATTVPGQVVTTSNVRTALPGAYDSLRHVLSRVTCRLK